MAASILLSLFPLAFLLPAWPNTMGHKTCCARTELQADRAQLQALPLIPWPTQGACFLALPHLCPAYTRLSCCLCFCAPGVPAPPPLSALWILSILFCISSKPGVTAELLHAQIRPTALYTSTEADYSERGDLLSTRQNVSIHLHTYVLLHVFICWCTIISAIPTYNKHITFLQAEL